MLTRDQGQRRISTVTIGLAAASVAGTLAVGAAAWAKESGKSPTGAATPSTATSGSPAPDASAGPPAAVQPDQPITPDLPAPGATITRGGDRPGHATSGGS